MKRVVTLVAAAVPAAIPISAGVAAPALAARRWQRRTGSHCDARDFVADRFLINHVCIGCVIHLNLFGIFPAPHRPGHRCHRGPRNHHRVSFCCLQNQMLAYGVVQFKTRVAEGIDDGITDTRPHRAGTLFAG